MTRPILADVLGNLMDEDGLRPSDPVTPESIAAAKAATEAERQRVFEATGLRITDQGTIHRPAVIVHCARCPYAATARSEGRAIRSLAAHLVRVHMEKRN